MLPFWEAKQSLNPHIILYHISFPFNMVSLGYGLLLVQR